MTLLEFNFLFILRDGLIVLTGLGTSIFSADSNFAGVSFLVQNLNLNQFTGFRNGVVQSVEAELRMSQLLA